MKDTSQTLIHYKSDIEEKFDQLQEKMEFPVRASWKRSKDGKMIKLSSPEGSRYLLEFKDRELNYLKSISIFSKGHDAIYIKREIVVDHARDMESEVAVYDYDEEKVLQREPYKLSYLQKFQSAKDGAVYVNRQIEDIGELRFDLRDGNLHQAQFSIDPKQDEVYQLYEKGKLTFRSKKKGFLKRFFN